VNDNTASFEKREPPVPKTDGPLPMTAVPFPNTTRSLPDDDARESERELVTDGGSTKPTLKP
jgi:hypothetical protein